MKLTQLRLFNDQRWVWCVSRPSRKPATRFSLSYCLWLAKSPGQRYEALTNQRFLCWECGTVLNPRWLHLHHVYGYENLGYEEASDLRAVHAQCHRNIHERERAEREAEIRRRLDRTACGCVDRAA